MSKSVGQLFREKVPQLGDRPALFSRDGGAWRSITWAEFDRNVRALALALDGLGLKKGDAVAIIANSSEQWTTIDAAALCAGYLVVGIYQSELADKVEYILDNCEAAAVFVEDKKQLEKVLAAKAKLPRLKHILGINTDGVPAGGKSYAELLADGATRLGKNRRSMPATPPSSSFPWPIFSRGLCSSSACSPEWRSAIRPRASLPTCSSRVSRSANPPSSVPCPASSRRCTPAPWPG